MCIAVEIECIKNRLEAIKKSRETYGIQDVGEGVPLHLTTRSENVEWRRRLASLGKDRDEVVHIRASYEISTYQMNMNIYFMKVKTATLVFLFIR